MHNYKPGFINFCQVCGDKDLNQIIDLGPTPPCDSLLNKEKEVPLQKKFPLVFQFCKKCINCQINYIVNPTELFHKNYPYRSGITKTLVEKLQSTSTRVSEKFTFNENSLCIDVGSNDGTLLKGFKKRGFSVLGVEATDIAKIAIRDGINTIQGFFNSKIASEIKMKYGKAKVVTATNVFPHISNIKSFLDGVFEILDDDGVFVSESHYLLDLVETLQYDSIYHEHMRYYSVHSIEKLLSYYGMYVVDVERIKNYGGSIRIFAQKQKRKSYIVNNFKKNEIKYGLNKLQTFKSFAKKVEKNKLEVSSLFKKLNKEGKKIVGIGCPGRASTFVNFCKLDVSLLPSIAEQSSSLKLGMFLPGTGTPIIDEKIILEEQPEYCVILSWHYAQEIIKIMRSKGLKSKIIIPLPEIKIIE